MLVDFRLPKEYLEKVKKSRKKRIRVGVKPFEIYLSVPNYVRKQVEEVGFGIYKYINFSEFRKTLLKDYILFTKGAIFIIFWTLSV